MLQSTQDNHVYVIYEYAMQRATTVEHFPCLESLSESGKGYGNAKEGNLIAIQVPTIAKK